MFATAEFVYEHCFFHINFFSIYTHNTMYQPRGVAHRETPRQAACAR